MVFMSTVLVKSSRIWMAFSRSYRYRRGDLTLAAVPVVVVVVVVVLDGEKSVSELSNSSSRTLDTLSVVECLIMILLAVAEPCCPAWIGWVKIPR
jgi:hypothetical protein